MGGLPGARRGVKQASSWATKLRMTLAAYLGSLAAGSAGVGSRAVTRGLRESFRRAGGNRGGVWREGTIKAGVKVGAFPNRG